MAFTASQKDREHFARIAKALSVPPKKITKEERVRTFDFGAYLIWLEENRKMIEQVKGEQLPSPAEGIERGHALAKKRGLLKYQK